MYTIRKLQSNETQMMQTLSDYMMLLQNLKLFLRSKELFIWLFLMRYQFDLSNKNGMFL